MCCSKCNQDRYIVNKHFNLCFICNQVRLQENQLLNKPVYRIKHLDKSITKNTNTKILEDEQFYEQCFNNSNHTCEECGVPLPTVFRDESGKIAARYRYSHILPKSIYPELRHSIENINHLCLIHHIQWDHGDKTSMKIYSLNCKKFPNSFQ